jgi:prepilin-type N-terminal cleavage/methylation domain-containing protein
MMKKQKKLNHKGFSLVEILVALAVGSLVIAAVVALLGNGLNGYRKQTVQSQLQDEANLAMNQINNAVMEALDVYIYNSDLITTTFGTNLTDESSPANYYYFNSLTGELKVGETSVENSDAALLCRYVEEFRVQIVESSIQFANATEEAHVTGIKDPVRLKITLKLTLDGITREITRVTGLRNNIDDIEVNGEAIVKRVLPSGTIIPVTRDDIANFITKE